MVSQPVLDGPLTGPEARKELSLAHGRQCHEGLDLAEACDERLSGLAQLNRQKAIVAWGITSVSEKQSPGSDGKAPLEGAAPSPTQPAATPALPTARPSLSARVTLIDRLPTAATGSAPPTEPLTWTTQASPTHTQTPFGQTAAPSPIVPLQANKGRSAFARAASITGRAIKFAAIAFAVWFTATIALTAVFRFVDPPMSMLMLTHRLSGETIQHEWVPLAAISPNLRRAVITSEDGKFCRHYGFDLGEIRAAMRSTEGFGRGASTITQQLAKNLFLWPGKSYVRKALEVPLTLAIEGLWPKRRILEVYLNIVEWGPGVFGAEAAAQYHFGKQARQLTEREAAQLAVALPNPIARDAAAPNPALARRASTIQARMRAAGASTSSCVITAR
jgi:monofunctional glycosyltransferase